MTQDEARDQNIEYLIKSAEEALASAEAELIAQRRRFAMNRLYYACFYAVSAVLLRDGRHFVKHAGVRVALHHHLVSTGAIPAALGEFYDELFRDRQAGDYSFFVEFDPAIVRQRLALARQFVDHMKRLVGTGP